MAVKRINDYFEQGVSFNQETTLCGNSILKNIKKAKQLGYFVEIHYVGVNAVDIAKERVAHRVSVCNRILFYDNTLEFERFAIIENGNMQILTDHIPEWFKKVII